MNKKVYLLGLCVAASATVANAQQLPNVGFGDWKETNGTTILTATTSAGSQTRPGTEPEGWNASNIHQVINVTNLCTKGSEGTNTFVSLKNIYMVQNIPGYMVLGTPWVFAYGKDFGMMAYATYGDGGSFGGIDFSYKPDAISFKYRKPTVGTDGVETSHVIAYLWNGSFKSNVPSVVTKDGVYTYGYAMDDVDRVVFGRQQDENVTDNSGKLIAKIDYEMTSFVDEWTPVVANLEYVDENASLVPEKLNVILAASDYWTRPNLQGNTQLDIDDVDFVYYSTLTDLKVNGETVALKNGEYEYAMSGSALPTVEQVVATTKSQFAEAAVTVDSENAQVRIVVTNQDGKDVDGETSHTYVLQYEKAVEAASYEGYLNIALMGSQLAYNQSAAIEIADKEEGLCTFSLPDFNLGGTPFGDIVVDDVTVVEADGVKTYSGSVDGLTLAGGIVADVELSGTIDADNVCDFNINVTWNSLPISVTFTTEMVGTDYEGYLNVSSEALGGQLVDNQLDAIRIAQTSDNTCTFMLNDLTLSILGSDITLGDIVVDNVNVVETDGVKHYNGTAEGLQLVVGSVNVEVEGTIDANNICDFKIDVDWKGMPINVTFTTNEIPAGVEGVSGDAVAVYGVAGAVSVNGYNGVVEVYAADGRLVKSVMVDGNAEISLNGGLYIVRAGSEAYKVFVK